MRKIILISIFAIIANCSFGQIHIITVQSISSLEKSIVPFALLDTSSINKCNTFLDSFYITSLNHGKLQLGDIVKISKTAKTGVLDSIAGFINTFGPFNENVPGKVVMRIRIFDCNNQRMSVLLNLEETKLFFRFLNNTIEDESIKIRILEYINYYENQSEFNLTLNNSLFYLSDTIELAVENNTNDTQYFNLELLGSSDSIVFMPLYQDVINNVPGLIKKQIKLTSILPNAKTKYRFPVNIIVKNPNYNENLKFFHFNIIYDYTYSPYHFRERRIDFLLIHDSRKLR